MSEARSYAPVPGSIPGTELNLGGVVFVMPPLNLNAVRKYETHIANLGKKGTVSENIEEALPILHAALVRNYPDLTVEQLRELVDMGNYFEAVAALTSISGFKKVPSGEARPPSP
jgi:hypothetical protein